MKCALILISSTLAFHSADTQAQNIRPIVEIDSETYRETYLERVEGAYLMSEHATMIGISGTAGLLIDDKHAFRLQGRYAQGKSDYKNSRETRIDGQDRYVYELRATYEYTIPLSAVELMPSIGIGYRNLTDRLDQITNDERLGYRRESRYTFLTAGLKSRFASPLARLSITPQVVYNYLLKGTQYSSYDEQYGIPTDIHQQRSGRGLELSSAFSYLLENGSQLAITPFYRYWRIADSEACDCGKEPANTTKEIGAKITYRF